MTTTRPWGTYEVIATPNSSVLVKKIVVKPKSRLSLQSHEHRSEHWIVTQGVGKAVVGEDTLCIGKNSHIYIPRKVKHRMCNTSDSEELVFVEVQMGAILEESDIVRYEDDYNRTASH